jgi:hypothetical protein
MQAVTETLLALMAANDAMAAAGGVTSISKESYAAAVIFTGLHAKAVFGCQEISTAVQPSITALAVKFFVAPPDSIGDPTSSATVMKLLGAKYSAGLQLEKLYDAPGLSPVFRLTHPWRHGTHKAHWVGQFRTLYTELNVLHVRGYVHCDVREANLVFDGTNPTLAWLLDFDFARHMVMPYVDGYNWELPERKKIVTLTGFQPVKPTPFHDLFALGSVMAYYTPVTSEAQGAWTELVGVLQTPPATPGRRDINPSMWPPGLFIHSLAVLFLCC